MENGGMTTDEFLRIAAVGAVMPLWGWISQKAYTHLRTKRAETGCCLEQRVAYRLGRLWARGYKAAKQTLHRL